MKTKPVVSCITFKLKIPNISKQKEIYSPEFSVCGLPWQFYIERKCCGDKHLLSIYLRCMKGHDKLAEWSCAASGSVKLLTFDNSRTEFEELIGPYIFNSMDTSFGRTSMISWNELVNAEKMYVKDDTVNLELKIDVADPFDETKSQMIFARQSNTKFRMLISNINNLMATRSPPFMFQKIAFNLVVYKSCCSHLGVYLYKRGTRTDKQLKFRMSAKLISPKDNTGIEKIHTNTLDQDIFKIEQLISWDSLFDLRSGFVDNNNIIIEVELMVRRALPQD